MKKIFSFLSIIVLTIFVSVFSVACKDKYKNMYLEVQYLVCEYVETQEGKEVVGEWQTVNTDPEAEDFGLSFVLNDIYKQFGSTGNYYLRMRVLVKGTKKNVEKIYVSSTSTSAEGKPSKSVVTSGEEFYISFSTIQSLSLTVTPCVKSESRSLTFPMVFYSELSTINANPEYYPAVTVGGELALNKLTDLIVHNGTGELPTNQLGVVWSIPESEGAVANEGVYVIGDTTSLNYLQLDTRNNLNKITVGKDFVKNSVTLKATSVYKDFIKRDDKSGLDCEVELKIVDNVAVENINLNYKNLYVEGNDNENNSKEINEIYLFEGEEFYNYTELVLSGITNVVSKYNFHSATANYDVNVLVYDEDNDKYENIKDYNNTFKGVNIVELESAEHKKVYNIELYEYEGIEQNLIKFVVGFKNLRFTEKDYNLNSSSLVYNLKINREDLPKAIMVNGKSYYSGDTATDIMFTEYVGDAGYELNVSAVRELQKATKIAISFYSDADKASYDTVKYYKPSLYSFGGSKLSSNGLTEITNKVYLKFEKEAGKNYPTNLYVEFKALASPDEFNGQKVTVNKKYIAVTLNLSISGSLVGVSTTTESGSDNELFNTGKTKLVQANASYKSKIELLGDGGLQVAPKQVVLSSDKNSILFSDDGSIWLTSINCGALIDGVFYIKAEKGVEDKIVVTAANGNKVISNLIKFVETVGERSLNLSWGNGYVYKAGITNNYYSEDKGYYLAMLAETDTDFMFYYEKAGQKVTDGICLVEYSPISISERDKMGKTISKYAVNGVKITPSDYWFNVEAKATDITTIVKIIVNYYYGVGEGLTYKSDEVYLEIALYTAVNNLTLTPDNEEIYYVHKYLTDKAKTNITVTPNLSATEKLYFSDETINNVVNNKDGTGKIYSILVNKHISLIGIDDEGLYGPTNFLDLTNSVYSLALSKNVLTGTVKEIAVEITFTVNGLGTTYTTSTKIYIVNYNKAVNIKIEDTYDQNLYLSTMTEDEKSATFIAYTEPANTTYKKLKIQLYEFKEESADYLGDPINDEDKLVVAYNDLDNTINVTAKDNAGGRYVLRLIAQDSYDDIQMKYLNYKDVIINVSDGSADNPYRIKRMEDLQEAFKTEENKKLNYVLANNVSLSRLTAPIVDTFSGSINGVLSVFDVNTGTTIYTQYAFTGLRITNSFKYDITGYDYYSFIGTLNGGGQLLNLIFDGVVFDMTLDSGTEDTVNIGVVGLNKGTILNCSVIVDESEIEIPSEIVSNSSKYNIGALVGENQNIISFYDALNSANKKYANNLQMADYDAKFNVIVNALQYDAEFNFGGLIGYNSGTITGNYFNHFDKQFEDYLTANINIGLEMNYVGTLNYKANVGGFVGCNENVVTQLAVTGVVEAKGSNINAGGLIGVGVSGSKLTDSSAYSVKVVATSSAKSLNKTTDQYIGGVAGTLAGTIDTVNAIFVDLTAVGYVNNNCRVSGVHTVGGLVGNLAGTVTNGNVQNFLSGAVVVGDFCNNEEAQTIGGLVGKTTGTIETSFVRANLELNYNKDKTDVELYTIAKEKYKNSFFVGNVEINSIDTSVSPVVKTRKELDNADFVALGIFNASCNTTTYSLVIGYLYTPVAGTNYYYGQLTGDKVVSCLYIESANVWINDLSALADGVIDDGETVSAPTVVTKATPWSDNANYTKYNAGLPVLEYEGKITMFALPEELTANVVEDEFVGADPTILQNENGIFIEKGSYNSAIVFLSNNVYNIIGKDGETGLFETIIDPEIATKEYYIKVIAGSDKCVISGNNIRFTKTGRIELEFISLFNNEAKDNVVIYVENGIDDFNVVYNGHDVDKLELPTKYNALLHFESQFLNEDSTIDEDKLFLEISGYDTELKGESKGPNIVKNNVYNSFAALELKTENITTASSEKSLTFNLYLDLAKYVYGYKLDGTPITYEEIFGENAVKIVEKEFKINIYQSATNVIVTTPEQTVPSSYNTDIKFKIVSNFTKSVTNPIVGFDSVITNNLLKTTTTDTETFSILLKCENDIIKKISLTSLWDLFDYSCGYSLNDGVGYDFVFNIELKDIYKALITAKVKFEFIITAYTNVEALDHAIINYAPQNITNLRIENFKSGVVTENDGAGVVEYISNETTSSIIVPGKNGLIKLYVEPYFACVDVIEISSSYVTLGGKNYIVKFQQMLYNVNKGHYVSYPGYTTEESTLRLQKNSYIDSDGNKQYNGIIYVRTVLENIIGAKETFVITANAYTYVRDENGLYDVNNPIIDETKTKPAVKHLVTAYNPGVSLTVSNVKTAQIEDAAITETVYLIEKTSRDATIYARINGYHLNQMPTIDVKWVDSTITDNVLNFVHYSIDDAVKEGEVYVIPIKLVTLNVQNAFTISISLSLINEGNINTSKETIKFYPVDYVFTEVYLKNSANNFINVEINSSIYFDFVWLSANQTLNHNSINTKWFNIDQVDPNILNFLYTTSYNASGVQTNNYLAIGENAEKTYKITADISAQKYSLTALGEDNINVTFKIGYSYIYDATDKKFKFEFGISGDYSIVYNFTLNLVVTTDEDTPDAIYNVTQLKEMGNNGNYILMADLVLTDWVPLTASIASLDGNGKVLTIKSFAVNSAAEVNAGIFANIGQNTIIKNLVVNIGSYQGTTGNGTVMLADEGVSTVNFGFIAGKNAGLIYNSEVVSLSNEKEITITTSSAKVNVGGFVGINSGVITNSRVGTPYFEQINVDQNGVTSSSLIQAKTFTIKANGSLAGFVATNSGTISSCYFNNGNIVNTNAVLNEQNKTAGFVALNDTNGKILGSYSKGKGINSENVRGNLTGVSNTGAGASAGFVYENKGLIKDSYSNLFVKSSAYIVAGFVYVNKGTIQQSYSASEVSSNSSSKLAVELPFVGVDGLGNLQSFGTLENCYYLEINASEFDNSYVVANGMDVPTAINKTNFQFSENLVNFGFVNGNYEQTIQGVWTYFSTMDPNNKDVYNLGVTVLPELTSANIISRSIRYIVNKEEDGKTIQEYVYANGYQQGTKQNPYIIRDYKEYNNIFKYNEEKEAYNSFAGHIRFIQDISFKLTNDEIATINTTLGFTLGDKTKKTLTVVDGNGMTISGVYTRNNENEEQSSLGLFNNVSYSIIKNLNVKFESIAYTSTTATYSGGLAGTIDNSYVVNIDLQGKDTTISAHNFAGGLAGIVTGESGMYNINSNLNVKVGLENLVNYYQYINKESFEKNYALLGYSNANKYQEYLSKLSYAGGLAGVIDIDSKNGQFNNSVNLNKIVIGQDSDVTIVADVAGFVAGHLSRGVNANRLKSVINNGSFVDGSFISAGLVAENYGKISYSQVAYLDNGEYDKAFANYIVDNALTALDNSKNAFGNLQFVTADSAQKNKDTVASGFIGINYGGEIYNSYTKANITANSKYIGGFIGVNYNGKLNSVYAQSYIDLANIDNTKATDPDNNRDIEFIGGLIGYNANVDNVTDKFKQIYKIYNYENTKKLKLDTTVAAIFVDKQQIKDYLELDYTDLKFDYLLAKSEAEVTSVLAAGTTPYHIYALKYDWLKYFTNYIEDKIDSFILAHSEFIDNGGRKTYEELKEEYYDGLFKKYKSDLNNLILRQDVDDLINADPTYQAIADETEKQKKYAELKPVLEPLTLKDVEIVETIDVLYNLTHQDQSKLFTTLFLTFDINVWEKDNKKYFPLLIDDPVVNYYEINTEADLLLMVMYPNAHFVLMGNVELGKYVNYVVDVEFTGTLTGKADDHGNYPAFTGIELTTNDDTETAGFFKKTIGAKIYNVGFEYKYLNILANKDSVGLVSPEESDGEIVGVKVKSTADPTPTNGISVTGPVGSVCNFGGLFGTTKNTSIVNCEVDIKANLTNIENPTERSVSNVGGLVGYAQGSIAEGGGAAGEPAGGAAGEPEGGNEQTTILSPTVKFVVNLTNIDNYGGLVGQAQKANIEGGTEDGGYVISEVNAESNSSSNIGGLIGKQINSFVTAIISKMTIKSLKGSENTYNIAGVSGTVSSTLEVSKHTFVNVGAELTFKLETEIGCDVIAGGLIAKSEGLERIYNSVAWCNGIINTSKTVWFGGLVALVSGSLVSGRGLAIDNCMAYVEEDNEGGSIDASGLEIKASEETKAGGIVGYINSTEAIADIRNSSVSGSLWIDGKTYTGGIIGEWSHYTGVTLDSVILNKVTVVKVEGITLYSYSTQITNCYSTLTCLNTKADSIISAIIGYIPKYNGSIATSQVYYSSDWTLCFEENEFIDLTNIKNLVGNSMLLQEAKNYFFKNGWTTVGDGLPYRTSVSNTLSQLEILTRWTTPNGYSVNPKRIRTGEKIETDATYKYFVIDSDSEFEFGSELLGAIIGCGNAITSISSKPFDLKEKSFISNLTITISNDAAKAMVETGTFALINDNQGTLFNIVLDYFYNPTDTGVSITRTSNSGGLVITNSGTINACLNAGFIEEVVNCAFGGIATKNKGLIVNTGFVGTITGNSETMGGICSTNEGTIKNSYSAGVISKGSVGEETYSTFVHTNTTGGKILNCYYDKFANAETAGITPDGVHNNSLTAVESLSLVNCDVLTGNWVSYPMGKTEIDGVETTNESYNFGYPIYKIEQNDYNIVNGEITVSNKGIKTGKGEVSDPYLVTHLGTIKLIKDIPNMLDSNYKLVNDIDLYVKDDKGAITCNISWEGIGTGGAEGKPFSGTFTAGFKDGSGSFVVRKINNLVGNSGLFNAVGLAQISNLAFGNVTLSNTGSVGALANTISGNATISNVVLGLLDSGTGTNMNIAANNVGGLIGSVDSGEITLNNINLYKYKDESGKDIYLDIAGVDVSRKQAIFNLFSSGTATNLGGAIGIIKSGTVTLNGYEFNMNSRIGISKEGVEPTSDNSGGLVGGLGVKDVSNGDIIINSMSIAEGTEGVITAKTAIGGIAGISNGGLIEFVNADQTLNLSLGTGKEGSVGGIVGDATNTTITGPKDLVDLVKVNIKSLQANGNAGGLIGTMSNGTVAGFEVSIEGEDCSAKNFGGLVGFSNGATIGNTDLPCKVSGEIKFNEKADVENLGAVVGKAGNGTDAAGDSTTSKINNVETSVKIYAFKDTSHYAGGIAGYVSNSIEINTLNLSGAEIHTANNNDDGGVGGLFGYLAENKITTAEGASIDISGLKLSAFKNVGGFSSVYNSEEVLTVGEGLKKYLAMESSYATILLPNSEAIEVDQYKSASNFGGLFGKAIGDNSMTFKVTGSDVLNNFVNKNNVLYYECKDADTTFNPNFSIGKDDDGNKYNCTVAYVGGIAGWLVASNIAISGENGGNVGSGYENGTNKYSSLTDKEYQKNETRKTILNISNVGGLVGVVSKYNDPVSPNPDDAKFKITDAKNSAIINGFNKVGGIIGGTLVNTKLVLQGVESSGTVYGRKHVAGVIGYTDVEVSTESDASISVEGTISGHSNLGALIGTATAKTEIGAIDVRVEINGLSNVGGLIGHSESETTINLAGSSVETEITANSNVGGVVGFANNKGASAKLTINGGVGESVTANIKPIQYVFGVNSDADNEKSIYMPTSIGGVVGYANDLHISELTINGEIEGDEINNISATNNYVIDAGSFTLGEEDKNETTCYKAGSYNVPTPIVKPYTEEDKDYVSGELNAKALKSYEETKTGIGGFVGTLKFVGSGAYEQQIQSSTAQLNIYAPNGMNVGGYIGYYDLGGCNSPSITGIIEGNTFANPKSQTYIAGGLGVGGIFGALVCNNSIGGAFTGDAINIRLQEKSDGTAVQGLYVGAVAGRSTKIDGLGIGAALGTTINNSLGEYYGGLVGWLDGNMDNASNLKTDKSNLFTNPALNNYGGLVGLVNVDSGAGDIKVVGKHDYNFTVGILSFKNLEADKLTYEYEESLDSLVFVSKFLNKAKITISAGKSEGLTYNPLLGEPDSSGWDKEYSLFKEIQICSKNGETAAGTSDRQSYSIIPVYDAMNVLEVAHNSDDGKIEYTVYQHGSTKVLYHRYGVATYLTKSDDVDALKLAARNYFGLTPLEIDGKIIQIGVSATSSSYPNPESIARQKLFVQLYYQYVNGIEDENKKGNVKKCLSEQAIPVEYVEASTGKYIWTTSFYPDDVEFKYTISSGGAIDLTDKISYSQDKFKKGLFVSEDRSFSLFDIVGTSTDTSVREVTLDGNKWNILWIVLISLSGLLFTVYTILDIAFGWWGTTAVKNLWASLAAVPLAASSVYILFANFSDAENINASNQLGLSYLTQEYVGEFGFITNIYSREWKFDEGSVIGGADEVISVMTEYTDESGDIKTTLIDYLYYGHERPDDFDIPVEVNTDLTLISDYIASLEIKEGSTLPRYVYKNNAYYISTFDTSKRSFSKDFVDPSGISWKNDRAWFKDESTGEYYIYSGYVSGNSVTPEFEALVDGSVDGHVLTDEANTKYVTAYYEYDEDYEIDTGDVRYLNYETFGFKDIYWKAVVIDSVDDLNYDECVYFIYETHYESGLETSDWANGLYYHIITRTINTSSTPIENYKIGLIPVLDPEGVDEAKDFEVKDSYIDGTIYTGESISNLYNGIYYELETNGIVYWDGDNLDKFFKEDFKRTTASSAYSRTLTYYKFVPSDYPGYRFVEKTEGGSTQYLVYEKMENKQLEYTFVYDNDGNPVKLSSINDNSDLANYKISDVVTATDIYYIDNGKHFVLSSDYIAEYNAVAENYELYKVTVSAIRGGSYATGKSVLELTNAKLYTRYNYAKYKYKIDEYLNNINMLPASSGYSGSLVKYKNTKFIETGLFNFSSYNTETGKRTGGIFVASSE